jgi:8-oxo-dGTP pyrophosphatase MutT (NUDIX family)
MPTSSDQEVFRGSHFSVFQYQHEIPGVGFRTFEYAYRVDGTRILAINEHNQILITSEYRLEQNRTDYRLPGGKLDFSSEDILQAAARELREETGVMASKMQLLWSTTPEATIRFRRHFVLASDLTYQAQNLSEGEKISVNWYTLEDAYTMAIDGRISEEISALAVIRYLVKKNEQ